MNNILPLLVVSILVISGLGAVAIPNEKQIENISLNTKEWKLEINVEGGILGYQLNIENVGNETINGSLTINITTDALIMLRGQNLKFPLCPYLLDLSPSEKESFNPGPIIGFGPATITIEGEFVFEESLNSYSFDTIGSGFVFLIFTICDATPINIP